MALSIYRFFCEKFAPLWNMIYIFFHMFGETVTSKYDFSTALPRQLTCICPLLQANDVRSSNQPITAQLSVTIT